jgi:septal ring factor EnvC (AmiA/AmiB activator)
MIIIDHGKGYMSLYGNNQSLIKQQGDVIKGGSTIAIVGNSGGNSTNGLYYQLRKNSKPFNPLKWTKLK